MFDTRAKRFVIGGALGSAITTIVMLTAKTGNILDEVSIAENAIKSRVENDLAIDAVMEYLNTYGITPETIERIQEYAAMMD